RLPRPAPALERTSLRASPGSARTAAARPGRLGPLWGTPSAALPAYAPARGLPDRPLPALVACAADATDAARAGWRGGGGSARGARRGPAGPLGLVRSAGLVGARPVAGAQREVPGLEEAAGDDRPGAAVGGGAGGG